MSNLRSLLLGMALGASIFALGAACGYFAAGGLRQDVSAARVTPPEAPQTALAAMAETNPALSDEIRRFNLPFQYDRLRGFGGVVPRANFAQLPLVEAPRED